MRRALQRGIFVLIVAALMTVLIHPEAGARKTWCPSDPYLNIGGKQVHVWVASTEGIFSATSEPVKVQVAVPGGVSHELIAADDGFGFGYVVEFVESDQLTATEHGVEIEVSVLVPAAASLPVKVDLTAPENEMLDQSIGETNGWIIAATQL